ncbi:MAG: hypothetical protein M3O06_02520 [Pseudomonadota bacterium]|nr:hypothetical protein [Pseudomonadota bacterium]
MKAFIFIVAWCVLLLVCWPLAIAAIALWPVIWVLSLPFRLAAFIVHAGFAFMKTALFLPARMLGHRPRSAGRPT